MEFDPDGPEPIYRQIAAVIRARIEGGTYPPNRKIPSERELCEEFDVTNKTVRAGLAILIEEGRLRPVRGRGVFVTPAGTAQGQTSPARDT
jgi:GntR family transcriptional regulator